MKGTGPLSSSHFGPSVLRSSCAFARGAPLDPGRLRRPWETSNSPKPSRSFQPEKGRFRPPLSSPLADGHSPSPPAPPGSLSSWDQRGGLPLSGHSTARTIRHLSLHPFRRLRRLIQDCRGTRLRPRPAFHRPVKMLRSHPALPTLAASAKSRWQRTGGVRTNPTLGFRALLAQHPLAAAARLLLQCGVYRHYDHS